jgi:hypothetical protein
MKKLQWDKIPQVYIQNSIWDKLVDDTKISLLEDNLSKLGVFDQIESLFSIAPTKTVEKVIKIQNSVEETFLDNNRAQNISLIAHLFI